MLDTKRLKINKAALLLLAGVWGLPALGDTVPNTPPNNEVAEYVDGFLKQFSSITEQRRGQAKERAMVPLLRYTKTNYEVSPVTNIEGSVDMDPVLAIIAKLWTHGPKSWEIKDIEVHGDKAFAQVDFYSVKVGRPEPIPFGFEFCKMAGEWKINGFIDIRSLGRNAVFWRDHISLRQARSPEAVFTRYMDKIEEFYAPDNADNAIELAPQIKEELSPWWVAEEESEKAMSVSMMTFSQLQPRNWQLVSSDYVEKDAELIIKASAGNPVMRRNLGMASMMGSGLKFTLERVEDQWLLKEYGRDKDK